MSAEPPSDEALFVRYREEGDLESFGQLYDRYASPLLRFHRRLLRDSGAAEDLTQQTFLKLHEARGSFDETRAFRTWAFTIAHRLALNWLERAARRTASAAPEDAPDSAPSPERWTLLREEVRQVERALAGLSRGDAEVILLAKVGELSHQQIADVVGCSAEAAKMRVHRALQRLGARLAILGEGARSR